MNTHRTKRLWGFNSLDLLAMIIAVAIVAMIGYAQFNRHYTSHKVKRIQCISKLKNLGLSARMWSGDNGDKYPSAVSVTNGGVMELTSLGSVFPYFQVMSNEIGVPVLLICPEDRERDYATGFSALATNNIGYFVSLDADESQPQVWLLGDRNLATNNEPLKPGLTTFSTNTLVSWTTKLHANQGNVALSDGSVQQLSSPKLRDTVSWALPIISTNNQTNWSFRVAIP